MAEPSRARLFFNEVISKKEGAFALLAALVNGGDEAAENGWRDYKVADFIGRTAKPDEDKQKIKETWSENLSAFANTGGGVLIWGLHTQEKIPDRLALAQDCAQLADLLRSLTNDATDPYVTGVEVEAITQPVDAKAGMVICYIPASNFAPHQAQWGERTYFIRTQDSNLPCPQPLLRTMFYPRAQSRLEPIVKLEAVAPRGAIELFLEVRIVSLGPATADVAIVAVEPRDFSFEVMGWDDQWEQIADKAARYRYPLPPNFVPPHHIRLRGTLLSAGASLAFRFFTHNTPAHQAVVSFTQEEVLNCLRNKAPVEKQGRSNPIQP